MDDLKVASGGLLSSAFHSLTGPDHLGALLPFIFCKRWYIACLYGLTWGAGHGLSSSAMGVIAASLKGSLLNGSSFVERLSSFSNVGIGLTLIVIGLMGLHELNKEGSTLHEQALLSEDSEGSVKGSGSITSSSGSYEMVERAAVDSSYELVDPPGDDLNDLLDSFAPPENDTDASSSLNALAADAKLKSSLDAFFMAALVTQFANGFLLGLAIDAMPSVAPALSYKKSREVLTFFGAYTLGSMLTMGLISGVVGQSTSWLGTLVVSLPTRLATISSYCSLLIGCGWIVYASHMERELLVIFLVVSPCIVVATVYVAVHPSPSAALSLLLRQHCPFVYSLVVGGGAFSPVKKLKVEGGSAFSV